MGGQLASHRPRVCYAVRRVARRPGVGGSPGAEPAPVPWRGRRCPARAASRSAPSRGHRGTAARCRHPQPRLLGCAGGRRQRPCPHPRWQATRGCAPPGSWPGRRWWSLCRARPARAPARRRPGSGASVARRGTPEQPSPLRPDDRRHGVRSRRTRHGRGRERPRPARGVRAAGPAVRGCPTRGLSRRPQRSSPGRPTRPGRERERQARSPRPSSARRRRGRGSTEFVASERCRFRARHGSLVTTELQSYNERFFASVRRVSSRISERQNGVRLRPTSEGDAGPTSRLPSSLRPWSRPGSSGTIAGAESHGAIVHGCARLPRARRCQA